MSKLTRTSIYLCIIVGAARAESIPVPNFSFESPPVMRDEQNPFGALPYLDDWDETAVGEADEDNQNTGVFLNTDPPSPDRITNAHLDRLAFFSSLTGNAIRQQLTEVFEPGRSYTLTVGIATSFNFPVAATEQVQIALFYFNGGVEQIVGSTLVSGSNVSATSLVDVSLFIPPVNVGDAWANQPIGVLIRPNPADPDDATGEGFWNADHVRLEASDSVPAASTWGLIIIALLMVTTGMIVLNRREAGLTLTG